MSETAKSALRTIILELARRKGLQSIEIGVAFDLDKGRFRAIEFKIDPKVKFIIEPAVLELIADVEWQQVWKWIEEVRNSGNRKLAYEIFKRRYPAYDSIPDSILEELFRVFPKRDTNRAKRARGPQHLAPTTSMEAVVGLEAPRRNV
jgi:hypothetical protein